METKYTLSSFLPTSLCLLILLPILGYFVYGKSIDFALAVLILLLCYELTLIIGCLPFVGALAQGLIMWFFVNPLVFSLTGLYPTWLTTLAFLLVLIYGILMTILSTLMLLVMLSD